MYFYFHSLMSLRLPDANQKQIVRIFLIPAGTLLNIALLLIKLEFHRLYMHVVAIIVYSKIHVSKNSHYRETSQEFGVLRITIFKRTIKKLHLMAVLFVIFLLYITRYIITIHSYTDPYLRHF